ncbi:immunity 52 family protein [Massilia glaciei]|uniref:Immunity protein 52 domain-containing protein n=1 Tax=Massilia glaciei TaxID=1524097 RepID=A0A2U2I6G8_9BURK|nr:immunity 52 family protein [Massilia glaciei]PWF55239.1 hypothetical protein C7C56_002775 [Massilia glaciei]
MKPTIPALELQYRRDGASLPSVETQFDEIYRFSQVVGSFSPLLHEWYLATGNSETEALQYKAFDAGGASEAARAVVRTKTHGKTDIRSISVWNGANSDEESAGMTSICMTVGRPDQFTFELRVKPEVNDWKAGADWIQAAVRIWPALFVNFGPAWYSEKKVFKDRPGVSWMLYLPRVLSTKQVPEASALVPVFSADKRQAGTIIVSITDEAFSDSNPEHVKIANDIEIRLVDQDLLPRYADL